MADYISIENKFIFTDEGKKQLIIHNGGIRFAILGALLIQNMECVDKDALYDTFHEYTLEDILSDENLIIGFKNISYISISKHKIKPENINTYNAAKKDITKYLFGTRYIPSLELEDQNHNIYGTYDLTFSKNDLNWDRVSDVSFSHFILIGKQYTETDDATFNVDKTQELVCVGIGQIAGNLNTSENEYKDGISFLVDQNKYLSYKYQLRFTLIRDEDVTETIECGQEALEVLKWSEHLSVVNDGLKTKSDIQVFGDTNDEYDGHSIAEDLNLNDNGALATTKTLMVTDSFDSAEAENQFNGVGLLHLVNRKDNNDKYKPQVVLTTVQQPENYSENPNLTAYSVAMSLHGAGKTYETTLNKSLIGNDEERFVINVSGIQSPIFSLNSIPEYDTNTVNIFGFDNILLGETNKDKDLFSNRNISYYRTNNTLNTANILFNANDNIIEANNDNLLFKSHNNILTENAKNNLLIGADNNYFNNNADANIVLGTNYSTFSGNYASNNIVVGGEHISVINGFNNLILNGENIIADNLNNKIIFGHYNDPNTTADMIIGWGGSDVSGNSGSSADGRKNIFEYYFDDNIIKINGADSTATITPKILDINNTKISRNGLYFYNNNYISTDTIYYHLGNNVTTINANDITTPMVKNLYGSFNGKELKLSNNINNPENSITYNHTGINFKTKDIILFTTTGIKVHNNISVSNITASNISASNITASNLNISPFEKQGQITYKTKLTETQLTVDDDSAGNHAILSKHSLVLKPTSDDSLNISTTAITTKNPVIKLYDDYIEPKIIDPDFYANIYIFTNMIDNDKYQFEMTLLDVNQKYLSNKDAMEWIQSLFAYYMICIHPHGDTTISKSWYAGSSNQDIIHKKYGSVLINKYIQAGANYAGIITGTDTYKYSYIINQSVRNSDTESITNGKLATWCNIPSCYNSINLTINLVADQTLYNRKLLPGFSYGMPFIPCTKSRAIPCNITINTYTIENGKMSLYEGGVHFYYWKSTGFNWNSTAPVAALDSEYTVTNISNGSLKLFALSETTDGKSIINNRGWIVK